MKPSEEFCKILEEMDSKYTTKQLDNGKVFVGVGVSGEHFSELNFNLFFDDDKSDSVSIKCFEICEFPKDKNLLTLQTVNALNREFRWLTFSATDEGIIDVKMDVMFTPETVGELVVHALYRVASILDEAFPILIKAMFSY